MPDHRAEPPFRLHRLRASVHELMLKLKELQGQKKKEAHEQRCRLQAGGGEELDLKQPPYLIQTTQGLLQDS